MDEEEEFRSDLGQQSSLNQGGGGRVFDMAAIRDMADDIEEEEEEKNGSRGLEWVGGGGFSPVFEYVIVI